MTKQLYHKIRGHIRYQRRQGRSLRPHEVAALAAIVAWNGHAAFTPSDRRAVIAIPASLSEPAPCARCS